MTRTITVSAALAATLVATALIPAAAFAATSQLRYGDLDLTSEAGRAELDRRIDTAAREACPAEAITGSRLPNRAMQERCIADVKEQLARRLAAQARGGPFGR